MHPLIALSCAQPEELMDEDLELLRRWQDSHDEQAFSTLYNRYLDVLTGTVARRFGWNYLRREAHRVRGAINDTWMRLARMSQDQLNEGAGRGNLPLAPLLATILRNLLVDAHRRDPRRREQGMDAKQEQPTEAEPLVEMVEEEDRQRLRDCVEQMPPQHRQTFRLLYEEGLTLQEAAQQMGLATAAGAFHRRQQMIKWLSECMGQGQDRG